MRELTNTDIRCIAGGKYDQVEIGPDEIVILGMVFGALGAVGGGVLGYFAYQIPGVVIGSVAGLGIGAFALPYLGASLAQTLKVSYQELGIIQ